MSGADPVRVVTRTNSPRSVGFRLDGWPDADDVASFDSDVELDHSGAAWLPAVLPLAMGAGLDISFVDPPDAVGLANAARAQDLLCSWYSQLHRVSFRAAAVEPREPAVGVGCFFSGGVDSFFSALERRDEITHLIFVHGFDIGIDDHVLADRALESARAAAAELGKTLIAVRTDIRSLSDRWLSWPRVYHGPALAAVGLLLSAHVGRVIIPSTYPEDVRYPVGSHPDLDPLWSTSRVVFEHHGGSHRRSQKIEAIASNPIALRHLRVCWENRDGMYNCGRCEKCVRTMIPLQAIGALEACATLPSEVDLTVLRADRRPARAQGEFARDNLLFLASRRVRDRELVRVLRGVVRRERFWRIPRSLRARARTWRGARR